MQETKQENKKTRKHGMCIRLKEKLIIRAVCV